MKITRQEQTSLVVCADMCMTV